MVTVTTLKKRAEFVRLKHEGKRVFKRAFVLQWRVVEHCEGDVMVAVGYTASTKGVGNAVKRNRARRRLRAAIDLWLRLNDRAVVTDGCGREMALIARQSVLDMPWELLSNDVRSALNEAGVAC